MGRILCKQMRDIDTLAGPICHWSMTRFMMLAFFKHHKDRMEELWDQVRWAVRVRKYILHWIEWYAEKTCAEDGKNRKRDREACEAER